MSGIRRLIALAIAAAAFAAPSAANAAIVTNGDFETGTFSGWHEDYLNPEFGAWFVYSGTDTPFSSFTIPAPPQGTHAAITDQGESSRQILYQDLVIPTGGTVNQLSLLAYYVNQSPGFASPETLSIDVSNEQYRIDVMKPTAPIDSVSSGDILLNLLRTRPGDPDTLFPTNITADLSAFAGQTVRLRFAVAVTQHVLSGGVDAVTVKSNGFTIGTATRNKKKGTAVVPLTLPDAGDVTVSGNGVKGNVVAASSVAAGPGSVNVMVKAKGKKRRKLNETGKVKLNATITYTPTGVSPNSQSLKLKLKKKRKKA